MTDLKSAAEKLRAAKTPIDIFGDMDCALAIAAQLGVLRARYTPLAKMLHPDRHSNSAEAAEAMALLNALYDRAQTDIRSGTWGKAIGITINATNVYTNVTALAAGDICDVYLGDYGVDKRAVIKVARDQADRDLVANEWQVLSALWKPTDAAAVSYQRYLPKPLEQTRLKVDKVERATNVLAFKPGGWTLREVVDRHGGVLDNRHVAWIWKRMLEVVSWVHRQGYVHGGITPDHVLVFPETHGIHLLDWSYATKPGGALKAISKAHRFYYPTEVLAKKPLTPGADLYMIAKCVVRMLDGTTSANEFPRAAPREYVGMIRACTLPSHQRYQDAFEIYDVLKAHLQSLFGPAKFIPMSM